MLITDRSFTLFSISDLEFLTLCHPHLSPLPSRERRFLLGLPRFARNDKGKRAGNDR